MNKKILLLMVVVSLCGFVFAENTIQENPIIEDDAMIVSQSVDVSIADKLNSTSMRYCIDGLESEKLSRVGNLFARPGQTKNVCMVLINNLPTEEIFMLGFSEGKKDDQGIITCESDMSDNDFLKLVSITKAKQEYIIDANSNVITNFKISVPKSTTENIYGCVAYYLSDSYSKKEGEIFGLLVRKIAPIEINITGSVYNFGRRDDIKYVYTDNKQTVLKILIAIIALWLIMTIVNTTKKKPQPKKKK